MKNSLSVLSMLIFLSASIATADIIVFDHDFENATSGNLSSGGAVGTPAVGTISATGGHISSFVPLATFGSQGRTYTTGSNGNLNNIVTVTGSSFNDVGTPAGNFVTANLSSPAAITGTLGAGQTTTVDFTLGSFGTNNATNFKYIHAIGQSSAGDEVFHILYRAGSGGGTREVFAREFGEDSTTFNGTGGFASVDGTKLLDGLGFHMNSTNTTTPAPGYISIGITIDENGWNASAVQSRGSGVQTPTTTPLGIASGATDLASIQFFTSQNAANGGQNNGFWLDGVLVQTVPEPSASLLLLGLAGAYGYRRRRY